MRLKVKLEDAAKQPPTFENTAELIAKAKGEIPWLAAALRTWVWGDERHYYEAPDSSRQGLFAAGKNVAWTRANLVHHLSETLPNAVNELANMLGDYTLLRHLKAAGPGLDRDELANLALALQDLNWRCPAASRSPELVDEKGRVRRGPGKVFVIGLDNEKVECASTVYFAWEFVRGQPPGSQARSAALAAERLFALGSVPVNRFDQVKQRRGWGANALNAWRPCFNAVNPSIPSFDQFRATLRAHLAAAQEKWRQAE